jgi:SAM-dependent methyltransferase
VIGPVAVSLRRAFRPRGAAAREFPGTVQYWETRYAGGGDSGAGSYSRLATFKAEVINAFVERHGIASVIELGCGDGNQLTLARYGRYVGFDVAKSAIDRCRSMFRGDATKTFKLMSEYSGEHADLALSLDVVYHLVEDAVFDAYMRRLFDAAGKFVAIYSSNDATLNETLGSAPHVRHRRFSDWIELNASGWQLLQHVPNRYPYSPANPAETSCADFYFYARERGG